MLARQPSVMVRIVLGGLLGGALASAAAAAEVAVPMSKVSPSGIGDTIGTITVSETPTGLSLKVDVTGISAGSHGFHIHENGSCEPGTKDGVPQAALAAGPHFDPLQTKTHKGPEGAGHKGDLPALTATATGVNVIVSVNHLKLSDIRGRSFMIHEGGDTYSDTPENGGGAARIACGVIPKE